MQQILSQGDSPEFLIYQDHVRLRLVGQFDALVELHAPAKNGARKGGLHSLLPAKRIRNRAMYIFIREEANGPEKIR